MKVPSKPPTLSDLVQSPLPAGSDDNFMSRIIRLLSTELGKDQGGEYLHWDKLRYKPLPESLENHEQWWLLTKLRRQSAYRKLPLLSISGSPFVYWLPDPIQKMLHEVDKQAGGQVEISSQVINPNTRDRYLVSSLIEEAITSSQLEGASTTSKVARAMLRERRKPSNQSERMIANNYRAMEFVRESSQEPLSKEIILALHRIVMENPSEDEQIAGLFRQVGEDIGVYDDRDNTLLHRPPPVEELDERISRLCDFANGSSDDGAFLHPIARSIILHFMIGYDHPFSDGNGRIARALFYWSMARHGYWMMEFVSISTILKNVPAKYPRAYLYCESDANDLTYFLDLNLRVMLKAIDKLREYLMKKANEIKKVEQILGMSILSKRLNPRQLALISHALRNQTQLYSFVSHQNFHNISYPTARSDLLELNEIGILDQLKISNAYYFRPVTDMLERLRTTGERYNGG